MELSRIIHIYLDRLEKLGWPLGFLNRSGFDTDCLESFPNIELEASLVGEFFSCLNGVDSGVHDTLDQLNLLPGFVPLSIGEAIEEYGLQKDSKGWRSGLFPIFGDWMGSFLAVDCSRNSDRLGRVYECQKAFYPSALYPSISDMFTVHTKAIDEKIIFVEDERYLEIDDKKFEDLCSKSFPSMEFWK